MTDAWLPKSVILLKRYSGRAPKQPAALMRQSEFHQHVGEDNICPNIKTTLERAAAIRAASPDAPRPAASHSVSTPRQ